MNILEQLRLQRLMGLFPRKPTELEIDPNSRAPVNLPINPPEKKIRQTPSMDALRGHLENAPKIEDHQLNKWGKLLAGAAGSIEGGMTKDIGRGIDTYHGITGRPYKQAKSDYESKHGRLKDLAEMEYTTLSDADKRNLQIRESDRQDVELGLKESAHVLNTLKTQADIDAKRAEELTNGKKWEVSKDTGNWVTLDLKTGKVTDSGVKAQRSEGEADTAALNMFGKQEGIRQAGRVSLEGMRQNHAAFMEGLRTANDKDLAGFKSNLSKGEAKYKAEIDAALSGMSATQQKAAIENAWTLMTVDYGADKVKTMKPDEFATQFRSRLKGVRDRAAGQVTETDVQGGMPQINMEATAPAPGPRIQTVAPAPAGKVRVFHPTEKNPDGTPKSGLIPVNELAAALQGGYKRAPEN